MFYLKFKMMAGAKETPRQKLINLMYLVLLAMLALQVSSVIIEKFQFLNASLEASNKNAALRSAELMTQIQLAVKNNKFNPKDVEVQDEAELIRKKSKTLVTYIQGLKKELIKNTGGIDEDGKYKGAKEEEKVAKMMLGSGDSKSGEGYELKRKLNQFVNEINQTMQKMKADKQFVQLALDAKDDPIFKNSTEQKKKTFAQVNFEGTPLVAALAMLSEKEASVRAIEMESLSLLHNKVGGDIIPVDKVRPVVLPRSSYVVAGLDYKSDLFMAAYSSTYKPKMTYNAQSLEVDEQGAGTVSFKAAGGGYDQNGVAKKTWKGTITYPKAGGGDSTYLVEQEYYVVKPVIQSQARAASKLYKNCGNSLSVQVPALGTEYRPQFSANNNAEVIRKSGGQIGEIVVVPKTNRKIKLDVRNNGGLIGGLNYEVKDLPPPTINILHDGKDLMQDQRSGIRSRKIRDIRVKIHADKDIEEVLPNDTKYKFKKGNILVVRGRSTIMNKPFTSYSEFKQLLRRASTTENGDRLIIEITHVYRKNYLNNWLPVRKLRQNIFSIPLQ